MSNDDAAAAQFDPEKDDDAAEEAAAVAAFAQNPDDISMEFPGENQVCLHVSVGGVVGAILLGIIYAAATKGGMVEYAIICGVGALISMVGDLASSAIKRNQGIKDYGKLIPGHGGILDRFDSVIFTAPIIYFLSVLLIH